MTQHDEELRQAIERLKEAADKIEELLGWTRLQKEVQRKENMRLASELGISPESSTEEVVVEIRKRDRGEQ